MLVCGADWLSEGKSAVTVRCDEIGCSHFLSLGCCMLIPYCYQHSARSEDSEVGGRWSVTTRTLIAWILCPSCSIVLLAALIGILSQLVLFPSVPSDTAAYRTQDAMSRHVTGERTSRPT